MMTSEESKKALVGNYICEYAIYIGRIVDIRELPGCLEGREHYIVCMDAYEDFVKRRHECVASAMQLERLIDGEEVELIWGTQRTAIYSLASKDGAAKTLCGIENPIADPSKVNGKDWHNSTLLGGIPPAFFKNAAEDFARERFLRNMMMAYDEIANAEWFDNKTMNILMEMPSCIAYVVEGNDTVVKSYGREDEIDNTERYMNPCEKRKS